MAQAIDPALLVPIAEKYGIDPQAFIRAAQIESSLGAAPDTPGSQYKGLFQLGTDEARRWGVTDVSNPLQNAEGAAKGWATELVPQLAASLGRDPTWGEVYLAHQQGVGGATQMILHPDQPAVSGPVTRAAVSGNIPGNLRSQYDPSTITGRQFADLWTSRFGDPVIASGASTNPSPGNLGIPDMMGVLGGAGPQSTSGLYALGGGAGGFDTPPVNAPQSGLSLDQIKGTLGDLTGSLGLLPFGNYALPAYEPVAPPQVAANGPSGYNPAVASGSVSALPPGPTVNGVDIGGFAIPSQGPEDVAANPPATAEPSPEPGSLNAFLPQSPASDASPYLPVPGYSGQYASAGGFQPQDVQSFPALGSGGQEASGGYNPNNPAPTGPVDTSNLTAFQLPNIFGGNSPGANAEPQYPPDSSQNWRDPSTGTYIFGSNAISSLANAAQKASDTGQDPMKAVYDDSYTSAPDSHIGDLKQLGKDVEAGQNVAKAASDIASNPFWASLGNAASDIGGMASPFFSGSGTQMASGGVPPPNAYAETPPVSPYGGKDPTSALDAVNWMGSGGLGNGPTAMTFGGFSPLGQPFDPSANPFATKKDDKPPPASLGPLYQSPVTGGFTPQSGWASFGSGTLGGQPWSMGSGMPALGSGMPALGSGMTAPTTRAFTMPSPQPMSYAAPEPQQMAQGPAINPFAPPPNMPADYGGIFQVPGMGPSFDPGSFSSQDAESLASAQSAYGPNPWG